MNKKNIETIKTAMIIVLALIIVFGGSYFASELKNCNSDSTDYSSDNSSVESENTADNSEIPENEQADLNEIDIDEYLALKEGEEKAIIYVSRPTCHYCQEEDPIIKNVVYEYGITVNYLNTDELDDDGQAKLIRSDDYFSEGYGTPLILVVQNDEIVDKIEGLTTKDNMISFFKEHEFIKE